MARASKNITELNWTSQEDRDIRDILLAWEAARQAKVHEEMTAAAAMHGERRFLQAKDGFGGEIGLMVHPQSFHYWGQRLGYECWENEQFKREYWRDNPTSRVTNHARQTTVTVPEVPATVTAKKRFSKRY